jgi:hypothetical protein
MKPDLAGLGWPYGTTALTSFAEPYDSWGDMSQVISRETWSGEQVPGSIGYLCGSMAELMGPISPPEMHAAARDAADNWMTANLATMWPGMTGNPLKDPRILSRYSLANFDLSDRYVQTPAGKNVASRLDPAVPAQFSNLYVIGDWTRTRFSGGAFESAVESAMLAARGISGFPEHIKTTPKAKPMLGAGGPKGTVAKKRMT